MMGLGIFVLIGYVVYAVAIIALLLIFWVLLLFTHSSFQLFFEKDEKASEKTLTDIFFFIVPSIIGVVFLLNLYRTPLYYQVSVTVFLFSSFVGFMMFLLLLHAMKTRNIERGVTALLKGAVVFMFFAPSGYLTLKPIVLTGDIPHLKEGEKISLHPIDLVLSDDDFTRENYDTCHEQEDFWMGGFCTSLDLNQSDIIGKWRLQKSRGAKESYFILESNGSVEFHTFYVDKKESYFKTITYLDSRGKWEFHSTKNSKHPYILIHADNGIDISFSFDSESTLDDGLTLQAQYDDPDAPYYLVFKREMIKTD